MTYYDIVSFWMPPHTLTMASFSPRYAEIHFCFSALAESRRSALFPTNMIGTLLWAPSYEEGKEVDIHQTLNQL